MLSIGTITAGGGYQYLTKEVTSGAEDYYIRAGTGAGESQGWWLGAQRQAFGIDGTVVEEHQMAGFLRRQDATRRQASRSGPGSGYTPRWPSVSPAAEAEHKEWVAR